MQDNNKQEDSHPQARKRGLLTDPPSWITLNLNFKPSELGENKHLLFILPSRGIPLLWPEQIKAGLSLTQKKGENHTVGNW